MKIRTRLTLWFAVALCCLHFSNHCVESFFSSESEHEGRPHGTWEYVLHQAREITFAIGIPAVVLGVLGGWWITRKALTPVTTLTEAMEKTHDRNLNTPLKSSGNGDELDRMTEVFNAMTTRLDESFRRIRDFTLHASHELKTPLAIMRGELEMTLREENLTPLQKERFLGQIDEVERLAKIVDALTLLTKADADRAELNFERVHFGEMIREYVADAAILAKPQNIQVGISACEEMLVLGDRDRLRQLVLNLLDNAIKYNQPGGTVNVSLKRNNGFGELRIENTGPGLAVELQPRVFERFFRGDNSHSSAIEGCGLGLSIAQWIVHAHKGGIQFVSEPDKRTVVTVTFPALNGRTTSGIG
jgi:signal transduction histidine kinase